MVKGVVKQEDITFINIYAPNIEAPKYIKKSWRTPGKMLKTT